MDISKIYDLVENFLLERAEFLVSVKEEPGSRIVVGLDSDTGVDLLLCSDLSRFLYEELSPEIEDYELEVGSVGITSPFTVPRQWQNAQGKEVELLLFSGLKEKGILLEVREKDCVLRVKRKEKPEHSKRKIEVEKDIIYAYSDIKSCVLVIEVKAKKKCNKK